MNAQCGAWGCPSGTFCLSLLPGGSRQPANLRGILPAPSDAPHTPRHGSISNARRNSWGAGFNNAGYIWIRKGCGGNGPFGMWRNRPWVPVCSV